MPAPKYTFAPQEQSIQTLLARCEDDWGTPEVNREMLLPFGVKPLDLALYGMDVINGELILIQGPEKQRKTTFVANIIAYYMQAPKPKVKPLTVIDTLESGMTPGRYRDTLISIVATQILLRDGHKHKQFCPVCGTSQCQMLGISPEFLRYNRRKEDQAAAIKEAIEIMSAWPLQIYGANEKEGYTRSLEASVSGGVDFKSRWKRLIEEYGAKVFVTDHLQQYSFFETVTDYEKQLRTIAAVSDRVAEDHIVNLLISQVSLGSQREAASGTGKMYATGGKKGAAEATSIMSVNYESGSGEVCITLEDSRKSGAFSVYQPLEDVSGAFYGEARQGQKAAVRPGMETGGYSGSNGKK